MMWLQTMTTRRTLTFAVLAALLLAAGVRVSTRGDGATPAAGTGASPSGPASAPGQNRPSLAEVRAPAITRAPLDPDAAALEGSVVDALSGAPIDGADLTFSLGDGVASARSAADGSFRFEPPMPGRWRLAAATAPGHLPFAPEWGHSPVSFDAHAGHVVRGVTIRLHEAIPMEGRVLGPEGDPVVGAAVRLLGSHLEAALVPIEDRFVSGADGRFAFTAPEGTVVEATAEGFLPGRADVDFVARARGSVTVRLQEQAHVLPPGAPISGRVVDKGGAPMAGALVAASRELGYGMADATAAAVLTGTDGAFTLDDLGAGWWRITARAGGRLPAAARRVAPGTRDLLLTLEEGGRLKGCATDASSGAPIVSATIHLFDVRSALRVVPRESRASIDPSGCWALDGLGAGPARVIVSAPGYAPSAPQDVAIPAPGRGEASADFRLSAGGRLTGVVVSEGTGAPIEGARVALEGQLEAASSTLPALAEAATDAAGRFLLTGLPRRASIFVAAAGHHARIVSGLEAPSGATLGPITVALRAAPAGEEPRVDLAGIGVSLAPHGDGFTITSVISGGGAERAGLARGDVILGVDGQPVTDLGMAGAVEAIRGPEGTVVTLTVRRGERTETVSVTRTVVRG
jgi:hypothetical protein